MVKKALTIVLTTLLITGTFCTGVFADPFVPSIGYKEDIDVSDSSASMTYIDPTTGQEIKTDFTPTIVEVKDRNTDEIHEIYVLKGHDPFDGCWVEIIVTPYPLKETIESNESYQMINDCYSIVTTIPRIEDLDKEDIEKAAKEAGCKVEDLLVTEIFDITKYHRGTLDSSDIVNFNPGHDEGWNEYNGFVEVTLKMRSLKNFVCLLHLNHEGVWDVVDSANVIVDGEHLYMNVDELSPFAVVVHAEDGIGLYDFLKTGIEGGPVGTVAMKCNWHWFMFLDTIVLFVLTQIVRIKDEDDLDTIKKKSRKRYIITILSLILDIIFFILGGCFWCIVALILELIAAVAIVIYTKKKQKKNEK